MFRGFSAILEILLRYYTKTTVSEGRQCSFMKISDLLTYVLYVLPYQRQT